MEHEPNFFGSSPDSVLKDRLRYFNDVEDIRSTFPVSRKIRLSHSQQDQRTKNLN